jgi:hypothetical protein
MAADDLWSGALLKRFGFHSRRSALRLQHKGFDLRVDSVQPVSAWSTQ